MHPKDMIRKEVTRDLPYTGFSVRFLDFSPDCLWGALFYVRQTEATPVDLAHHGRSTVFRFCADPIQEGENRWRDIHYSYWQHLS